MAFQSNRGKLDYLRNGGVMFGQLLKKKNKLNPWFFISKWVPDYSTMCDEVLEVQEKILVIFLVLFWSEEDFTPSSEIIKENV